MKGSPGAVAPKPQQRAFPMRRRPRAGGSGGSAARSCESRGPGLAWIPPAPGVPPPQSALESKAGGAQGPFSLPLLPIGMLRLKRVARGPVLRHNGAKEKGQLDMQIHTIPCLADNYAYLAHDEATGETAVIDVPDAAPVEAALKSLGWSLARILITHHHADHIDGVERLRKATGAKTVGNREDARRLPDLDFPVSDGEFFMLGGAEIQVMDVSGHTVGHIAFHMPSARALFSADSLMALGCGRVFEGTPEMMWSSLSKMAALPPDTLVYSGHEYTRSNAAFARTIEPGNPELLRRISEIESLRAAGKPTVPSSLSEELATNPFLRASLAEVKEAIGMPAASDAEAFAEIRSRKDRF